MVVVFATVIQAADGALAARPIAWRAHAVAILAIG
jgi:hypothetical protein